ncbi:hypothetical protein JD844_022244 [Phrynosoma platyrhinos]|uniref:Uncharacterized protein n=1 Tax=Phrynosoma platyrhinos TaxID=52577 RepID=A0ABQ7SV00_PHRPL|nr:hypothetical protein JD844_022244 [Phrynosoma platyrhinos]
MLVQLPTELKNKASTIFSRCIGLCYFPDLLVASLLMRQRIAPGCTAGASCRERLSQNVSVLPPDFTVLELWWPLWDQLLFLPKLLHILSFSPLIQGNMSRGNSLFFRKVPAGKRYVWEEKRFH